MNYLDLEDRLYTSTEVAKILGVSLRSVYRYLEDNKLDAEIRTATGRHRFTKQNILDFLSPQGSKSKSTPVSKTSSAEQLKSASSVNDRQDVQEQQSTSVRTSIDYSEEKLTPIVEDFEDEEDIDTDMAQTTVSSDDDALEVEKTENATKETVAVEEDDEEVDWLAKFRAAAEKYKAEVRVGADNIEDNVNVEEEETLSSISSGSVKNDEEVVHKKPLSNSYYYTSTVGGLKDIAQNLDKSAQKASLDYAFTMDAGLSLHKPIRPFSLIHSYVRTEDLPFFEKILGLRGSSKEDAQLCLIASDDDELFTSVQEMHGLKVVSNNQLKNDLISEGKADLVEEL